MPWITPHTLTPSTHCQSRMLFSQISPPEPTPALLNTRCAAPNAASVSAASASTASPSDTSTLRATTFAPFASSSAATRSSASCCTSAMTTFMPSVAATCANSRPKPLPPPVMTAVRPVKSFIVSPLLLRSLRSPPAASARGRCRPRRTARPRAGSRAIVERVEPSLGADDDVRAGPCRPRSCDSFHPSARDRAPRRASPARRRPVRSTAPST